MNKSIENKNNSEIVKEEVSESVIDHDKMIKEFLNRCGIVFTEWNQLDGMAIPRDTLLSNAIYEKVKKDIVKLKELYSSGSLTSLQKNAQTCQKWPLLNLVRQILKSNEYKMDPRRKSNGYTPEGKKKYIRSFIIKKIKSEETKNVNEQDETKEHNIHETSNTESLQKN